MQDVIPEWQAILARFPAITETTRPLPNHSQPAPTPAGPELYDPRSDPDVLVNGMALADARARANPPSDTSLTRSLVERAKKAPGPAR